MALRDFAGGREEARTPPAQFKRRPIAGGAGARIDLIDRLRARIRTIERAPVSAPCPPAHHDMGSARSICTPPQAGAAARALSPSPWSFGVAEIDDALPWRGLGLNGVHEVQAASYPDSWAALGFALALLARRMAGLPAGNRGLALWAFSRRRALEFGRPHAPGLSALGLDPDGLVMVEAARDAEIAWVLEEGLKARALAILLGQVDLANWTLGRRLALAAEASRTPCLIVSSPHFSLASPSGLGGALTRWRVAGEASLSPSLDGRAPGAPRWRIDLERCRWGRGGAGWNVEWSDGANCFRLAAPLADRTDAAGEGMRRRA